MEVIQNIFQTFTDNNYVIKIIEMLSTILVLMTFLDIKKYGIISSMVLFVLSIFVSTTNIIGMLVFNITFLLISGLFFAISSNYQKIMSLRYSEGEEQKRNKFMSFFITFMGIVGIIGCLIVFVLGIWNILSGNVPYYIILFLAVPILSVAFYVIGELYKEIKTHIFVNFLLITDLEKIKSTIKNLGLYGYIENISEGTKEKLLNLRHPNFIINNLRQEISEHEIVQKLMDREERQNKILYDRDNSYSLKYLSTLEQNEQDKKDLLGMKKYVEKLNDMFGIYYMGILFEKISSQNKGKSNFIIETTYLLYLTHILGRYDSLKRQEEIKIVEGSNKKGKIKKNNKSNNGHYNTIISIKTKNSSIIDSSEEIFK